MPKRNGRLQLCTKWEKVAIRLLLIAVAVALVSLMGARFGVFGVYPALAAV